MKTCLALIAAAMLASATPCLAARSSRAEIQAALDTSAAAWSRADLNSFMSVYENAPTTIFVGGDSIVSGYRAIRDHYASGYAGAAAMGRLTIDILDYRPAGDGYAFIVGRYHLFKSGAPPAGETGLTSLLFHKSAAGWKIVVDHSD